MKTCCVASWRILLVVGDESIRLASMKEFTIECLHTTQKKWHEIVLFKVSNMFPEIPNFFSQFWASVSILWCKKKAKVCESGGKYCYGFFATIIYLNISQKYFCSLKRKKSWKVFCFVLLFISHAWKLEQPTWCI